MILRVKFNVISLAWEHNVVLVLLMNTLLPRPAVHAIIISNNILSFWRLSRAIFFFFYNPTTILYYAPTIYTIIQHFQTLYYNFYNLCVLLCTMYYIDYYHIII